MENKRWPDVINLMIGVWLLLSPSIGFGSRTYVSALNSWAIGFVVTGGAIVGLMSSEDWIEWVNLVAGTWLVLAPFVFGYSGDSAAALNHLAAGGFTLLFAAWGIAQRRGHLRIPAD